MHTALMVLMAIISIILILSVIFQSGNSDGLSGSIGGGAEQLFGKKKSRGIDSILKKVTVISGIAFVVLSLIILAIS